MASAASFEEESAESSGGFAPVTAPTASSSAVHVQQAMEDAALADPHACFAMCSWCAHKTRQERVRREAWIIRPVYACDACRHRTLPCRLVCGRMARGDTGVGGLWDEEVCSWCEEEKGAAMAVLEAAVPFISDVFGGSATENSGGGGGGGGSGSPSKAPGAAGPGGAGSPSKGEERSWDLEAGNKVGSGAYAAPTQLQTLRGVRSAGDGATDVDDGYGNSTGCLMSPSFFHPGAAPPAETFTDESVESMSSLDLSFAVPPGDSELTVSWWFSTRQFNIAFGVFLYSRRTRRTTALLPLAHVNSQLARAEGAVALPAAMVATQQPGELILLFSWDNSASIVRTKELRYAARVASTMIIQNEHRSAAPAAMEVGVSELVDHSSEFTSGAAAGIAGGGAGGEEEDNPFDTPAPEADSAADAAAANDEEEEGAGGAQEEVENPL